MRSTILLASALLLVAGCSSQEADDTASEAASAEDSTASAEASDYDVPEAEPGVFWFYKEGGGDSSAVYGPPDAGGYAMLICANDEVEIMLPDVDGLKGRETAILTSGPLTDKFKSSFDDEGMSVLYFSVPAGNPILKRFARDGFYVSFPNGEKNPFPPDGKIALALKPCLN